MNILEAVAEIKRRPGTHGMCRRGGDPLREVPPILMFVFDPKLDPDGLKIYYRKDEVAVLRAENAPLSKRERVGMPSGIGSGVGIFSLYDLISDWQVVALDSHEGQLYTSDTHDQAYCPHC